MQRSEAQGSEARRSEASGSDRAGEWVCGSESRQPFSSVPILSADICVFSVLSESAEIFLPKFIYFFFSFFSGVIYRQAGQ